jgi:hypothetical protein
MNDVVSCLIEMIKRFPVDSVYLALTFKYQTVNEIKDNVKGITKSGKIVAPATSTLRTKLIQLEQEGLAKSKWINETTKVWKRNA